MKRYYNYILADSIIGISMANPKRKITSFVLKFCYVFYKGPPPSFGSLSKYGPGLELCEYSDMTPSQEDRRCQGQIRNFGTRLCIKSTDLFRREASIEQQTHQEQTHQANPSANLSRAYPETLAKVLANAMPASCTPPRWPTKMRLATVRAYQRTCNSGTGRTVVLVFTWVLIESFCALLVHSRIEREAPLARVLSAHAET